MKLKFLITILVISSLSLDAQDDPTPYSFFIAGHSYGAPGVNNIGFHPPFKLKFPYIQSRPEIEFGVLTGDIVSPNPVAQDWDEIDADIDQLGMPVHFAVGNHDMEDRPLFESRYGITYYSFMHQNDLFIVLDPNIDGWNISGSQLQFLENTLEDNSAMSDNIYVFFHQILWKEIDNQFSYILWNSDSGRAETVNFWSEVEPLFSNLSNQVIMFAGDLGASWSSDVTYDSYDNITLISTGMGDEDGENFIVANVDADKSVSYDLICLSDKNMDCLGMLTDHLVVDEILNVDEPDTDSNIALLYPNPTGDFISVSHNSGSNTTIQLFTVQGKLILEETFCDKPTHTINVSHIPKGIYLARIVNDLNQSTIKLVIE